ncbi:MAG: PVC-type heme-binding CxxCH protein [Planctomycetota bacterium]
MWRLIPCFLLLLITVPAAHSQGLKPEDSLRRMTVPSGIEVILTASEPLVRQPVAIEFDDRGRLWVIQYLQYPNPEGLKRVQVDRYSRTVYDRIPEAPPHGPRGADRITILEDSDGDGRMDKGRDFVSGLNLATGLAFGHGGVFVLQTPYLLFYPDRNRDDIPDSDPEVLLSGFGMEDAHSVANSLTWGPDGWLYGCQGSTVTARIRGVEFQQGVWRYHPVRREFELFCEGGGNAWGLDFDRAGRLFYSTNYGGFTLVHGIQGAWYVKSFGKHGALHNPHAYGYFEHAAHENFRGGHVTVGGIVYEGHSFPPEYRGRYIAGDLLGHGVYWHHIRPRGSTVSTAHGGELLQSADPWFAPTDITTGPDGAIYVTDWHDARTAHPDPDADWDRSNGRIYRIAPVGTPAAAAIDFSRFTATELQHLHQHPHQWFVRRARSELARRMDAVRSSGGSDVQPGDEQPPAELLPLQQQFLTTSLTAADETTALNAIWSLNILGGFREDLALRLLQSPHPGVRFWTLRLIGDCREVSSDMAHRLDELAEQEPHVEVLQQLAATAARLPAAVAVPMINANINRDDHNDDPCLPLLWWWAVEKHSVSGRSEVLRRFVRPTLWKSQLGRDFLLPRLIRRYAAEGTMDGHDSLLQLLQAAPSRTARHSLWPAVLTGWLERANSATPSGEHSLNDLLTTELAAHPTDLTLLRLAVLMGRREATARVVEEAFSPDTEATRRAALLTLLIPAASAELTAPALSLLETAQPEPVHTAALQLAAAANSPATATRLIAVLHSRSAGGISDRVIDVLLSREAWALELAEAVDRNEFPASRVSLEQIRRTALFNSLPLQRLVSRHWGRLQATTPEARLAEVRRLNNDLRAAQGDVESGRALFRKHCAVCHQLFGEGNRVGPELTSANRQDRDFLLVSLVDPSSVIRREYVSVVVQTTDGRIFTGLPADRSESVLTLLDAKGNRQGIAADQIEELQDSPVSLMPENLYREFTPQQLRDLFAFLQR